MRLASPASLPTQNPLSRLHHPFATRAHRAILGGDCGIIFRNTKWQVEDSKIGDYFAYAKIRIPVDEPAIGTNIRLLHIWSIHAPPIHDARLEFWSRDVPNISILDAAAPGEHSAAIIGADWNAVPSPMIDDFPPTRSYSRLMPLGQLAQAGLVDSFRTLHPNGVAYTRHQVTHGQLVSARRIDSIWTSHSLVPYLQSVQTSPSTSDHSVVTLSLQSSKQRTELGPGIWRLHREAHLQPGFELRLSQYVQQLPQATSQPPIQAWYSFVERIRATTANIANSQRQQSQKHARKRNEISSKLSQIDIRHGDENRRLFLELLTML